MEQEKWHVIAQDSGSPLFRNYIWVKAAHSYSTDVTEVHIPDPELGIISKKDKIDYIYKPSAWKMSHEVFTAELRKDISLLRKIIKKTNELGEKAVAESEKAFNAELANMSSAELLKILKTLSVLQGKLYTYGILLPMLDFQENSFIEKNLREYLGKKLPKEKAEEYFQILSSPSEYSFALEQEMELLKLAAKYWENKGLFEVLKKSAPENAQAAVRKAYPGFSEDVQKHTRKYCWVYYAYLGPAFTDSNFLEQLKLIAEEEMHPLQKLKKIENEKKQLIKKKEMIEAELNPDAFISEIMRIAGTVVWAKPRRKDYQSKIYYHIVEGVMKEIATRLKLSRQEALSAMPQMIEAGLKGERIDKTHIDSLYNLHVVIKDLDTRVLHGAEAKAFDREVAREDELAVPEVDMLKGTIACQGLATGIVRIINDPDDMSKMHRGDILVSVATTPRIVTAMQKAAAIVTNEGGITCHAAIVSREMNVPCVVGTKIATKVLKDGDLIEVDANNGVVRKLK